MISLMHHVLSILIREGSGIEGEAGRERGRRIEGREDRKVRGRTPGEDNREGRWMDG